MASVLAGIALGATVLTTAPAATAAPVHPSAAAHERAVVAAETVVARLSHAKAQAGTSVLVQGSKLATWDAAANSGAGAWTKKVVKFGDKTVAAADVTVLSAKALLVKVPSDASGTVLVTVGDAVKGPKFTYVAKVTTDQAALTALKPTSEAGLAGQTVVGDHITKGTKILVGGKSVKFDKTTGGAAADGTKFTFDYPAGLTGEQDVVVTDNGFAYYLGYVTYTAIKPTITAASVSEVLVEAPTAVTLTGTRLDLAVSATFNGEKATFAKATDNGTKMVVTVPKGVAADDKDLVITTKYGETAKVQLDRVAAKAPTVTAVTGAKAAGGEVTLTGTNLVGLKAVKVYSTTATVKTYAGSKISSVTATSAKVTLPAMPDNAAYKIEVTTLFATPSAKFDFNVGTPTGSTTAPTVTTASASSDAKTITINGTNFTGATKVKFGTGADITTGITVDSATKITVVLSSALAAGTYDVVVTVGTAASTGGTGKLVVAAAEEPAPALTGASYTAVADSLSGKATIDLEGTDLVVGQAVRYYTTAEGQGAAHSATVSTVGSGGTAGGVELTATDLDAGDYHVQISKDGGTTWETAVVDFTIAA